MSINNFYQISISGNDYSLVNGPMALPINLYQTSSFDALNYSNPQLLTGLDWMGHPEMGFWSGVEENQKPEYDHTQELNIVKDLVPESGAVKLTYYLTPKPDADISDSILSWQNEIRAIRNQYLQMTDFTQLIDAPFTEEEKNQCRIFRQKLRDMFNGEVLVNELSWPSMPSALSM